MGETHTPNSGSSQVIAGDSCIRRPGLDPLRSMAHRILAHLARWVDRWDRRSPGR
jgi:hypothetical protein